MDSELKEVLKGIKGFRDFYPEDYAEYKVIFDAMHSVSKKFGYEEYESPTIEFAKLIEYKSGQELVDETYRLFDRENRKLVLRPELTPTLARLVVNQHQRYPKPMRWYSIPRVFRDETPQRGRVKEHYQFNADIIGVDHPAADAEIIALSIDIIKTAGLRDGEFICVINSRELLQGYIEYIQAPNYVDVIRVIDARAKYLQTTLENKISKDFRDKSGKKLKKTEITDLALKLRTIWQQDSELKESYSEERKNPILSEYLDQLSKIEEDGLKTALQEIGLNKDQADKLYIFVTLRGKPNNVLQKLKRLDIGEKSELALKNLEELAYYLELYKVVDNCKFDTSIARGLDYYTGIVYEFFDQTGYVVRAIAGGGRYDKLVESFGGGLIPATGIGMGETVLHSILKHLGRFEKYSSPAKIYVAPITEDVLVASAEIANKLRKENSVIFNPLKWKLSRQLEDASSRNVPLMIIIGKRDLAENKVTLRDLKTGEQKIIPISEIEKEIKKQLKK
jgi:histidyl-tRNA synthetase